MVGVADRLRVMGSLALSLCHLAAGRVDAVCSLKPARSVDIAAGQLLVRECGLAIELFEDRRSSRRRSTSWDVHESWPRVAPKAMPHAGSRPYLVGRSAATSSRTREAFVSSTND